VSAPAFRADGAAVDAAVFYRLACDPRRSAVVEACAGAGKTWMLVSRILRALLDGAAPEQVLAITFTRKAAGEMRERLDDWLRSFSSPACSADARVDELCRRGLSADEAWSREAALGELHARLLAAERPVQVRTFHAWFAQLLAQAPPQLVAQLDLPAPWSLVEEPEPYAAELFSRAYRRIDRDDALSRDYRELVARHRRDTVRQWLDSVWRRSAEVERADHAGTLEPAVVPAGAWFPEYAGLADPREALLREPLRGRLAALADELVAAGGAKSRQHGEALLRALERGDDLDATFGEAWSALHTKAHELRRQLPRTPRVDAVVAALQRLRSATVQHLAHADHRRMVRLSRALLAEYRELKREHGLVDMNDLERAAQVLLADPAAGWLQQRLDLRLRHVMIDEFQDTSPLQAQTLFGWLTSYAGAGGGPGAPAVFIVGDPKQSIYRFRGAEPRVFAAARELVVGGLGGHALECDHTRRNRPTVIEAVNRVFAEASHDGRWGPFRAHSTAADGEAAVWRLPQVPRLTADGARLREGWRDSLTEPRREPEQQRRQLEVAAVADTIAAWLAEGRVEAGEVMVLARARARLVDIAAALAARTVPFVMPEVLALADSPEALDLVAVLDVLASPGHDLSLARALKSPLFGADDDDLAWLASGARTAHRSWLDRLLDGDHAGIEQRPALREARDRLRDWREAAARSTVHELLDRVVAEGDYERRLAAVLPPARRVVARQAVDGLLAAALDAEGARFLSPYAFVRAVRSGRLQAARRVPHGAVQLLTVHGAKGLEADVVFVVDAEPERPPAERGAVAVDWPPGRGAPLAVALVRRFPHDVPSLDAAQRAELAEREREELNALYVAMTRARRALVFSSTEPHHRGAVATWWQRVLQVAAPLEPPRPPAGASSVETWVDELPPAPPWATGAQRPTAVDLRPAALGRAVHRLLEWVAQPGRVLPRERWTEASAAAAAEFGLAAADAGAVLRHAQAITDSPQCAPLFDPTKLRWAGNEVPLALEGEPLRIDRLVQLDDGDWWVLDFKLNRRSEELAEYRDQLERYRRAAQAVVGSQPVRAAFITGEGVLVEVDAS